MRDSLSLLLIPFVAFLCATPAASPAQEEAKFHFDTGTPPWAGERIKLPPGFAPDLGWNGVEEIRFAPGMFRPAEGDFFSYVLVFVLEPGSDVSEEGLQKELLIYYSGLSKAVMGSAGATVDTSNFSVRVKKEEDENSGAPASAPKAIAWNATLDWVEPFATKKRQTLHLELHTWENGDQPVVLSCVSPIDPKEGAEPWKALREIRKTFRLE